MNYFFKFSMEILLLEPKMTPNTTPLVSGLGSQALVLLMTWTNGCTNVEQLLSLRSIFWLRPIAPRTQSNKIYMKYLHHNFSSKGARPISIGHRHILLKFGFFKTPKHIFNNFLTNSIFQSTSDKFSSSLMYSMIFSPKLEYYL